VRFTFLRELLRGCPVAGAVSVVGARKAGGALGGFGAREVAEAVVLGFGVVGAGVVEGWVGLGVGLRAQGHIGVRVREGVRWAHCDVPLPPREPPWLTGPIACDISILSRGSRD
jgi:hypothetical protein